jgi:hypothetical protein
MAERGGKALSVRERVAANPNADVSAAAVHAALDG